MTDCKNWKTAISTGNTSYETLNRYGKANIKSIEVSVDWRVFQDLNWQEITDNAKKAGVEVWSFHLPFAQELNIASPDENLRQYSVNVLKEQIEKIVKFGVRIFVVHPSTGPIKDDERHLYITASKKSLAELAEAAAKVGATVCVENLPRHGLGHNVQEMLELVSAHNGLRVCFDVNHLLTAYGSTHLEFVQKLGDKIITTHMSDYDFIDEKHFFVGNGKINWNQLITAMEEADYDGPFLYEGGFSPSGWDPTVPHGTIEEAVERHMTVKNYYGK